MLNMDTKKLSTEPKFLVKAQRGENTNYFPKTKLFSTFFLLLRMMKIYTTRLYINRLIFCRYDYTNLSSHFENFLLMKINQKHMNTQIGFCANLKARTIVPVKKLSCKKSSGKKNFSDNKIFR